MVRTIKLIQMWLILISIILGSTASAYAGDNSQRNYLQSARGGGSGGGDFPWPWGFEVKFPWDDVQGIWKVQKEDTVLYFSLRRVQTKRIKIKQIDITTCQIVGTGQGLERDRTIVAQIHNTYSDETYNLTIYAFNEEDLVSSSQVMDPGSDHVIVARINSLDRQRTEFAAQMVRISDRLEVKCGDQDKKAKF
jgi:hypothetical protein